MLAGCPTFAANATSLPEVLAQGGEVFSLDHPRGLAALLRRVATDADYRKSLTLRAAARAADFSWRRTAQETLSVYRRLLRGGTPGVARAA